MQTKSRKLLSVFLSLLMMAGVIAAAPVTAGAAAGDVCEIVGGSAYATLEDAIDAVENGQTVRLLADITFDEDFGFDRKRTFTIDTNNKTLDFDGNNFIIYNYESNVTINGCEKLVNLGVVNVWGSMANYGLPLYKTVFNGDLTLKWEFYIGGYAQVEVNGNMTFQTADGRIITNYDGSKLNIKGNVTANQLASDDVFVGVGLGDITIEGSLVTSGVAAAVNGGKLTVNGNATANGVCGAYFFANGGFIYMNGAFTANETKYVGFTSESLNECGYFTKTQYQSTVKVGGVNYRQYEGNGALYVKASGSFIFNTLYESTFWNWLLFFLGFGFIWMWF
ncbi:MAG: hypothetical protein FWF05_02400 [Oscillospiraceae bacterium]|nr:hypothetical protein [Oscillospiraceae bacterium]